MFHIPAKHRICRALVFLGLLASAPILGAQDWALNARMGINLIQSKGSLSTGYAYSWNNPVLSVQESGWVEATSAKGFAFGLALERALGNNLFLSLGYASLNQQLNTENEYFVNWQFSGTEQPSSNWTNGPVSGSFHTHLLQMLVHRMLPLGLTSHLRLSAGLSMGFSHLKGEARFGFAEMAEDSSYYYFDWYRIPARIDEHFIRLMPTLGVECLIALDRFSEVVFGAQYLWNKAPTYRWETFGPTELNGMEGNLVHEGIPDIHGDQEQVWKAPSWNLSLTAGLRFRF